MMLYFLFRGEKKNNIDTTLVIWLLQSRSAWSHGHFSSSCCPAIKGCTGSWKGTQPRQLTQSGQMDFPYHMASCLAIKAVVKNEEVSDGVCLPKKLLTC